MIIQDITIPVGTAVDTTITPFDSSKKTVEITLTGRATGTVDIEVKSRSGDTFFSPSGTSSIDLTTTDTLIITGSSFKAVRIDDSGNTGANLTATIETY